MTTAAALDGRNNGRGDACGPLRHAARSVFGISIDTRTIAPGEAFFAITGSTVTAMISSMPRSEPGAGLAVVDANTRTVLPPMRRFWSWPMCSKDCASWRGRRAGARQAKIVAVTGSVGKTSTKEALRLALGEQGETHASAASYNNHWGVPLSLARCPESARFAVFELGMNHAGEIEPLSRLVRPQVAIITTIEPVHLEFFESLRDSRRQGQIFLVSSREVRR